MTADTHPPGFGVVTFGGADGEHHFRAAQQLIEQAATFQGPHGQRDHLVNLAQVHATLALVAAGHGWVGSWPPDE
jgi:hypothetical protein